MDKTNLKLKNNASKLIKNLLIIWIYKRIYKKF